MRKLFQCLWLSRGSDRKSCRKGMQMATKRPGNLSSQTCARQSLSLAPSCPDRMNKNMIFRAGVPRSLCLQVERVPSSGSDTLSSIAEKATCTHGACKSRHISFPRLIRQKSSLSCPKMMIFLRMRQTKY